MGSLRTAGFMTDVTCNRSNSDAPEKPGADSAPGKLFQIMRADDPSSSARASLRSMAAVPSRP
jgi:hypothetical protein